MKLEENEKILIEGKFEKKVTPIVWILFGICAITVFLLPLVLITFGIWYYMYRKQQIILCCTDKRIYCWKKDSLGFESEKEVYLDTVTDVRVLSSKLLSTSLLIITSGDIMEINGQYGCILNAEEIKDIIMKQKRQSIKSEDYEVKVVSNNSSSKEKIQELKELLDSGLITEEEYNKKKKDILDKM